MEPLPSTTFRTDATPVLWCVARSADPSTVQGRVVATAVGDGTGWVRRFAAAPLLAGALNRAGHPALLAGLDGTEFVVDPAIAAEVRDDPSITAVVADIGSPEDSAAVHDVLRTWSGLAAERQVLLAAPRSFCAGVERAVDIVERAIVNYGSPIYVRKQIVHNVHVVRELERLGAIFVDELDEIPAGETVIFSAHGVAPAVRERARERDLRVIDATCPLVSKVHSEARRFARRGDTIVLIGHAGHEESEGTLGVAPLRTMLVETAEDVEQLDITGPVSFLTQTTLAMDEAGQVASALRDRFPAIASPGSDDICYATTNRQLALREIAADSDLVLVIGSRNSSNSLRLVEIAERMGVPAYLIDSVADIELDWLAGTGTVETLRGLGPVTVTERRVADESIRFSLPKTVSHVDKR